MINTSKNINCCRNCSYYDGSNRELAECSHSDAPISKTTLNITGKFEK